MTDLQPVDTTATDAAGVPLPAVVPPPAPIARSATLDEKLAYAEALAKADMLPAAYRKKPANVLIAIEYGDMLGIATVLAITHIHVVEGKPTMSAEMMRSKVLEAGHRFDILEHSSKAARVRITRCDGRAEPLTVEFTIEDARRAQLTNKNNWKHYPASMLLARATSMVVRAVCPDATMGIGYVPEELGAEVDAEGNVISVPSSHTPDEAEPEWPKDYLNETPLRDRAKSTLVTLLDGDKEKAKEVWTEHFEKLDTTDIRLGHLRMAIGTFEADGTAVPSLPDAAPADESAATPQTDEQPLDLEQVQKAMAEAHELADQRANEVPGPLAAAPHQAMARTAEAIGQAAEEAAAIANRRSDAVAQGRTEPPSEANPAAIARPEQVAELTRQVSTWTDQQRDDLKDWVRKELGRDLRPSSHTPDTYARVLQHVMQLAAAYKRAEVRAAAMDTDFRADVYGRVMNLPEDCIATFQDLLDGLEGNPAVGEKWVKQLDLLPPEHDTVLGEWVVALEEERDSQPRKVKDTPDLDQFDDSEF